MPAAGDTLGDDLETIEKAMVNIVSIALGVKVILTPPCILYW